MRPMIGRLPASTAEGVIELHAGRGTSRKGNGPEECVRRAPRQDPVARACAGCVAGETTLAERYDVSRSPVREALIRLAGDELVVTLPYRSTIVAPSAVDSPPYPLGGTTVQNMKRSLGHPFPKHRSVVCYPRSRPPGMTLRMKASNSGTVIAAISSASAARRMVATCARKAEGRKIERCVDTIF